MSTIQEDGLDRVLTKSTSRSATVGAHGQHRDPVCRDALRWTSSGVASRRLVSLSLIKLAR
jgi:hypothetical protein